MKRYEEALASYEEPFRLDPQDEDILLDQARTLACLKSFDKDLADCAILLSKTRIRTSEQAQQVVERYLLPSGREKYAESIAHALRGLFEGKRG